jgi:hypothetical protein
MEDRNEDETARLGANEAMRKAGMAEKWLSRIESLLENPKVRDWLSLEGICNLRATMGALARIAERIRERCAVEMEAAGIRRKDMSPWSEPKKEA